MDVTIERYAGPHRDMTWCFRLAEDSESALEAYIDLGIVWVARTAGGKVIGHVQVIPRADDGWEVTNTAVVEDERGRGVGRALLERAVEEARAERAPRLLVATATADVGNLRFYQRCGFRMTRVVRDVFTPDAGYPPGLEIDGIPLRDQVWFECVL